MNSEIKADKEYQNNEIGVKAVQSDPFRKNFLSMKVPLRPLTPLKHLGIIICIVLQF